MNAGIRCPACGSPTNVVESRSPPGEVLRKRGCLAGCGAPHTRTVELPESADVAFVWRKAGVSLYLTIQRYWSAFASMGMRPSDAETAEIAKAADDLKRNR